MAVAATATISAMKPQAMVVLATEITVSKMSPEKALQIIFRYVFPMASVKIYNGHNVF